MASPTWRVCVCMRDTSRLVFWSPRGSTTVTLHEISRGYLVTNHLYLYINPWPLVNYNRYVMLKDNSSGSSQNSVCFDMPRWATYRGNSQRISNLNALAGITKPAFATGVSSLIQKTWVPSDRQFTGPFPTIVMLGKSGTIHTYRHDLRLLTTYMASIQTRDCHQRKFALAILGIAPLTRHSGIWKGGTMTNSASDSDRRPEIRGGQVGKSLWHASIRRTPGDAGSLSNGLPVLLILEPYYRR